MPPTRVLVLKPDALGDLLLATPALGRLRQGLPGAKISGMVGPWSRMIWATHPALDTLHTLEFPGFARTTGPKRRLRPYVMLLHYALVLRRMHYDAALLFRDDHWWGAMLIALAGIPIRIGHAHPRCRPFLTHALPYDPREHVSRQSLDVVTALLGQAASDTPPTFFEPGATAHAWAAQWCAAHLGDAPFVVIHPGASGPTKAWPPERWAAVGQALVARGWQVVLSGGPDETDLVRQVAAQIPAAHSVAGATSIPQLAALLARAHLMIGGDTGPLHLAVSQGCASLHLFGPSDPGRFGPWGDPARHRVVAAGLACSPCSQFQTCPRQTQPAECMQKIAVEQVVRLAVGMLDAA
ncbi:glycosyl transferase family protein [Oscillochloris trichoides DG-6]|uniref:Glycosyl transferase family protein n=1 Tax=Oscillochloris trichoides DG-6 TaxID=765420 RepID=E1IBN9_9CHLR|nr:glycosyltransferase family 9 protein [Oscillochloris trichoides]EFO81458.1 glycosyl transferase family protein [Oscillochloris trichoides DG-6]